ncbi:Hypothetical protein, putative [Bodo saltans]|uniref:Membrane-associated protein n=1 Tax=Bodo saltans TaxID=75058 RepID=A0A0S4JVA7_BODSA|nr:Hypothetical protein, putative [Bodo saltans]|eukprot:CUG93056.1 Hypothetical protein, putative [Bodo saltans]
MKVAIVALLIAGALSTTPTYPTVSNDFVANISINEGAGGTYTGWLVSDVTGHRSFRYVKELNETTYSFQTFGSAVLYVYTIMNSGCTCQVTQGGVISDYFSSIVTAKQSTKACNGTSGTLYVNDILTVLPAVPNSNFCVDGTTPKYVQTNDRITTFTNFVAGRPDFPVEPMNTWQDACNNACL